MTGGDRSCPARASPAAPLRQIEDRQSVAVSAVHREGLSPRLKLLRTLCVLERGTCASFCMTVQSNMAVVLRCPLPCCAADTGNEGGPKSHVVLQGGREGTQSGLGDGFSEELL